mgnify:CR=1 FL=1
MSGYTRVPGTGISTRSAPSSARPLKREIREIYLKPPSAFDTIEGIAEGSRRKSLPRSRPAGPAELPNESPIRLQPPREQVNKPPHLSVPWLLPLNWQGVSFGKPP